MAANHQALHEVLHAAQALLEAREDQMLTRHEWDALQHAVARATQPSPDEREESFAVEEGALVRRVVPRRGQPYEHRCDQASFEAVAHAIDELGEASFVLEDLRGETQVPWTQVAVALAFMKERGCVVPVHGRKHRAAWPAVYADAMIEYHALREKGPAG